MGSKILVCGGGGFIGSHFVQRMIKGGSNDIVCVDIKPINDWFQIFDNCENYSLDLKSYQNCLKVTSELNISTILHVIWEVWVL